MLKHAWKAYNRYKKTFVKPSRPMPLKNESIQRNELIWYSDENSIKENQGHRALLQGPRKRVMIYTLRHNQDRADGSNGSKEVIPLSSSNQLRGIILYTKSSCKEDEWGEPWKTVDEISDKYENWAYVYEIAVQSEDKTHIAVFKF